jgi:hypothetical protein
VSPSCNNRCVRVTIGVCPLGLLNYNFQCLKQSITEVFQASNKQ